MEASSKLVLYAAVLKVFISSAVGVYVVWEGAAIVLPCGPNKLGDKSITSWCKMNDEMICKPVLYTRPPWTETSPPWTEISPPWTSADVQLVEESSINITSVSYARDNGTFRCTSSRIQVFVELLVHVPVRKVTLSGPVFPVSENTKVTFTCETEGGNPTPIITWEIPETSAQPEPTVSDISSQTSLTLTGDMNNQELVCRAQQGDRQRTDTIRLNITYKPTVEITITPAEYYHGDHVSLTCSTDGNPDPVITWRFDDKLITDVGPPANTLHIGELNQSHAGTYTCLAVNSEGNDTASANVTVTGKKRKKLPSRSGLVLFISLGVVLGALIIELILTVCYFRLRKSANQAMNPGDGESMDLQTMPENAAPENVVLENAMPENVVTRNAVPPHNIPENVVEHSAVENLMTENDLDEDPRAESPSRGMACAAAEEHEYEDISDDLLPAEKHMPGMTKVGIMQDGIIKPGKNIAGIAKHGKTLPEITRHGRTMPEKATSEDVIDEVLGATVKGRGLRSDEGGTHVVPGDAMPKRYMAEKTTQRKASARITEPPKELPLDVSATKAMPESIPYENVNGAMTGARPKEYVYDEPSDIPDESPPLPFKKKPRMKVLPNPPHKKSQKPKKVRFTSPPPSLVLEPDTAALMTPAAPRLQVHTCPPEVDVIHTCPPAAECIHTCPPAAECIHPYPPAAECIHTCPSAAEVAVEVLKLLNVRTQPSASGQMCGHEV